MHPSRDQRPACLHFAAQEVTLRRSESASKESLKELPANLVHVWEPEPPAGEVPVEWKLLTTEPVETIDQILAVVDAYRARWLIEELFKALKTGCSFEKRQFALVNDFMTIGLHRAGRWWPSAVVRVLSPGAALLPLVSSGEAW